MSASALNAPRARRPMAGESEAPTSDFVDALIRLFDAGQAVVLDRIDLLRLQMSDDIVRFAISVALIGGGVLVALAGYLVLMAGVTGLLMRVMAWEFSLLLVGGTHVVAGAVLALVALKMERIRKTRADAVQEMVHAA